MTNWKKRYEQANTENLDRRNRLDIVAAESDGLADFTCLILNENKALWDDWTEEHATAVRLRRKVAKLTKRLKNKGNKP